MFARLMVGVLIACGGCADDYVVKVGLFEFPGSKEPVVEVPPSAAVGERLGVFVTTVGGGCIEPFDTQAIVTTDGALVVPRDEYYVGDDVCTLCLQYLRHNVAVTFDTPGTKTITIRVRRERRVTAGSPEVVDEIVEYPFAVVVD